MSCGSVAYGCNFFFLKLKTTFFTENYQADFVLINLNNNRKYVP